MRTTRGGAMKKIVTTRLIVNKVTERAQFEELINDSRWKLWRRGYGNSVIFERTEEKELAPESVC